MFLIVPLFAAVASAVEPSSSVRSLLRNLHLEKYERAFDDAGYYNVDDLVKLSPKKHRRS